jgi:hypothetical protein
MNHIGKEIQPSNTIQDADNPTEITMRTHILNILGKRLESIFSKPDCEIIERSILQSASLDAQSKFVSKHFDNGLFQVCYMNAARRLISNLDPNNYVKNSYLLIYVRS